MGSQSRALAGFPPRAVAAEVRDTLLQLFLQDESEEVAGHVTAKCDASQNVQLAAGRGRRGDVSCWPEGFAALAGRRVRSLGYSEGDLADTP